MGELGKMRVVLVELYAYLEAVWNSGEVCCAITRR